MYHALENDDIIYAILQHVKSSTTDLILPSVCSGVSSQVWDPSSCVYRKTPGRVAPDDTIRSLSEFRSDFALLRQFFLPGLETLAFDVPVDVPTSEVEQFVGALYAEASGLWQLSITVDPGIFACHFEVPKMPK
ncbi:hypothetical protein EDD22DRAFT_1049875, partial [Suillus occidentalis]